MTSNLALNVQHVSKAFGAVQALRDVSLQVAAGQVHALVGENGAGKSTLIKIITGAHAPDAGRVELAGIELKEFHPLVSKAHGVAAVYQQPTLFPDLSVAENLALGLESTAAWRWINWPARRRRAEALLERVGAKIHTDTPARRLSMPQQQLVEIARALGAQARLVIMDEPTASLNTREVEHLLRVVKQLRDDGVGVLYVTHRLEELSEIAQQVTVLRDGAWVKSCAAEQVTANDLVQLMVGREVSQVFPKRKVVLGEERLSVANLNCQAVGIRDVSLSVRAGEVLGIGGLMGAGRTELAQVLFGLNAADSGEIRVDGQAMLIDTPASAIQHGFAYVPEDRRHHGVIPELSLAANISMGLLDTQASSATGWGIDFEHEVSLANDAVEQLRIKTASVSAAVATLSGGNQQKVALARWLATQPRILILDEPTQGIDVGAKAEIHLVIGELASQGMAIILISSELLELLGVCDRIAVMREGTISGVLDREQATPERVMQLALSTWTRPIRD